METESGVFGDVAVVAVGVGLAVVVEMGVGVGLGDVADWIAFAGVAPGMLSISSEAVGVAVIWLACSLLVPCLSMLV